MVSGIKNQLRQLRRRVLPASRAASTRQYDAAIARLDEIERRLAALPEIERRLAALPEIESRLAALPEIESRLAALPAIESRLAALPAIDSRLAALPEIERRLAALPAIDSRLAALPEVERKLQDVSGFLSSLEFVLAIAPTRPSSVLAALKRSKSQLRQDVFVLSELGFKRNGFFVEFGATNGEDLSNTYLLEKEYGWNGILAEPARCWHDALSRNRGCHIEKKSVWSLSDQTVRFRETEMQELSTIDSYAELDHNREYRVKAIYYDTKTISLMDLLNKYDAPNTINYMSVDTEGSEFDILSNLDFSKYKFDVITCEHNFSIMRQRVYDLLTSNGYIRKHEEMTQWDDWYVKA
jgi:Methyltransferase FkbM domain